MQVKQNSFTKQIQAVPLVIINTAVFIIQYCIVMYCQEH